MIRRVGVQITKNNVDRLRYQSDLAVARTSPHPWPSIQLNFKRNTARLNSIVVILKNLITLLFPDESSLVRMYFAEIIAWLEVTYTAGSGTFVDKQKLIFNYIKVSILSKNHEGRFFDSSPINTVKDYPKEIDLLINLIHTADYKSKRRIIIILLLSIFEIHKVLVVPSQPSLESITAPNTGTDPEGKEINVGLSLAMLKHGLNTKDVFRAQCENHEFHTTSAAGPNGHGLWAASKDAVALRNDPPLFDALMAFIEIQNLPVLKNNLEGAWSLLKFAGISESEGDV
jgi:hypothetical protein